MITKHVGGEVVKGGVYWSMSAGEFISIPSGGGRLAGGRNDRYLRAPLPVVLVVGPVLGLAFAIFLPLSGLMVLIPFLAEKLRMAITPSMASPAAAPVQPGAPLLGPQSRTGSQEQLPRAGGPEADESRVVDLAKEIAERRWQDN